MPSGHISAEIEGENPNLKKRKAETVFNVDVSNRFDHLSEEEMDRLEDQDAEEVKASRTKVPPIVVHTPIKNHKSSLESVANSLKGELLMKS